MATRTNSIINSFITGEISPFMLGRTDFAKYTYACEQLENFIVRRQGGVSRRPGLRTIQNAFGPVNLPGPGRLIPFIFSSFDSFVLAFLDQQIMFFKNDTQVMDPNNPNIPYVISSPYLFVDDLEKIKFTQIEDVIYLVHPLYPVQKLQRLSDTNWIFTQPNFSTPPATQEDQDISGGNSASGGVGIDLISFTKLTPGLGQSSVTGSGKKKITISSGGYPFTTAMIGQTLTAGLGQAQIISVYGDSENNQYSGGHLAYQSAIILITTNFDKLVYNPGEWSIPGAAPIFLNNTLTVGLIASDVSDHRVQASSAVFIEGDVGKQIVAGTGVGLITSIDLTSLDATHTDSVTHAKLYSAVTIVTVDDFDKPTYTSGTWFLRGSPNAYLSCGVFDSSGSFWHGSTQFGEGSLVPVRTTAKHPTDSSFEQSTGSSYVHIQYTDGFVECFRGIDKERFVSFAGGYGHIHALGDSTSATVHIHSSLTKSESDAQGNLLIASSFPGSWFFEDEAFSEDHGYPQAICFFQDRIWLGGTQKNPQRFWASGIDDYENFAKGDLDDAGLEAVIASGGFDAILWLAPYQGNIIVGTYRSEYVISGSGSSSLAGGGPAITGKNLSVSFQSAYGVTSIQPLIVEEALLFVQRSQTSVYEMMFNIQNALYTSRNLSLLNEIIATSPIIEAVYQHEPHHIIWFLTSQNSSQGPLVGKDLIGLTYDRSENVFAWHRHRTGNYTHDSFISMCCIPTIINGGVADEMWFIVNRQGTYFLEVFDFNVLVDAATVYNSEGETTVAGVGYLSLLGELHGNVDGIFVLHPAINAGVIDLGFLFSVAQIGLRYDSTLLTVRPEVGRSSQGLLKRWVKIWTRVYQSIGLKINGNFILDRNPSMEMGVAVPLFTGDEEVNNLGYDRDARIEVKQDFPFPANILCLFGTMLIGDI